MFEENYDLYGLVSFKLVKNSKGFDLLKRTNLEYEYFKAKQTINPDFVIIVDGKDKNVKIHRLESKGTIVNFNAKLSGLRRLIPYSALRNLYVRPLLFLKLIRKKACLIHASGVALNNRAYLFIGKAGSFKTSILTELIKNHNAQYIGEENVVLYKHKAYPFPLNIRSFSYKLKHFIDENPKSTMQKIMLGMNVFFGNSTYKVQISRPCPVRGVVILSKGKRFSIKKASLSPTIMKTIVKDEKEEISIPPTHTLSGIKKNDFGSRLEYYIKTTPLSELSTLWENFEGIVRDSLKKACVFTVTMPPDFEPYICESIMKEVMRN